MPTTAKKLLTYPDSSGHTRMWEHLQTLAQDVDRELDKISPTVSTAWSSGPLGWYDFNSGTQYSVGNGTQSSRWQKNNRTVHFGFSLVRGSTTNVGASQYLIKLPVPAQDYRTWTGVGVAVATATEPLVLQLVNNDYLVMIRPNGSRLAHNSFAWATGHLFQGTITYESAA